MKQSVKTSASLKRRQDSYHPTGPNPSHVSHLPGSQNRNKGASAKVSTR